jgi:hypothetical protein
MMRPPMPTDEMGGTGTHAEILRRPTKSSHYIGMVGQSQIVIAAKVDQFPPIHFDDRPLGTLQYPATTIEPMPLDLVETLAQ